MSKLALPPLSGLSQEAQSAFRAIASWANTVQSAPVVQQTTTINKTVSQSAVQADRATAAIAERVANRIVGRRSGEVMIDILQNSGTLPAIEMNAPVLFKATNKVSTRTHEVYIGAGGLIGAYQDDGQPMVQTFSVAASDGSFSFGAEDAAHASDPAHKQIIYDATANVITFGADIVIQRSGGATITLDDLADSAAGYTTEDLKADLAAGVGEVVAGVGSDYQMLVDTTNNYIAIGRVGAVFKGNAVPGINRPTIGLSAAGLAMGYNRASDGAWVDSVAIDASGNASFSGSINATSGNFTGTLNVGSVIAGGVTVNGTTMLNIQTGAAAGSTAVQPAALANYISKSAVNVLSGTISPASGVANSGAFKIGTIMWDTSGNLTSGSGIAITAAGIIGAKSGIATFSVDSSGNAFFKGDISGASGTFSGDVVSDGKVIGKGSSSITVNGVPLAGAIVGVAAGSGHEAVKGYLTGGFTASAISGESKSTNALSSGVHGDGPRGVAGRANITNGIGVFGVSNGTGPDIYAGGTGRVWLGGPNVQIRGVGGMARVTDSQTTDGYLMVVDGQTPLVTPGGTGCTLIGKAGTNNAQGGWVKVRINGQLGYIPFWT